MSLKKLLLCGCTLLLSTFALAATIPTSHFFEHAKVSDMKVSPDGTHVAFTYEHETEVRLAVMELGQKKIKSSFAYGDNKHVVAFHWANPERLLMEVAEITGNLVSKEGTAVNLYAANIDGSKRKLIFETGATAYRILHMLPEQPNRILIAKMHWAERKGMRPFTLDIYTGKDAFLGNPPPGVVAGIIPDNTGNVRIGIEFVEGEKFDDNKTVLHLKEGDSWQRFEVPSKRKNPTLMPIGFTADNQTAYFISNYDLAEGDRHGLFAYHFATKSLELISRHDFSDISGRSVGHDGEVLAIDFQTGFAEYDFINKQHPASLLLAGLKQAFEGQKVSITSFDRKGELALFKVSSDRNRGEFYLYDLKKKQARFLAAVSDTLKSDQLVPMKPIQFTARDGKVIRGFLTMPANLDKNAPLIVNVHGGPFGVADTWGFNPEAQFFANRGYATLQINFRGSGGYGEDFQRAGRLQWGKTMQDDVTDATLWAVEQGFADKERICIYGGSYGGYAALWGVIKEPDLYKCSVGYVGVYDMTLFFNGDGSDASSSPSIKKFITSHVGTDENYMRSISPAHHVDKIKANLFIVHGSKDVRVPIVHAEKLREALDKIGKPYEWMVKEDGHGFYKIEHRIALYDQMLAFFEKNIGKKAQ